MLAKPKAPPVVVLLACGAAMWAVAEGVPSLGFALDARRWVAGGLGIAGVLVAAAAVVRFVRARTTVNPLDPAKASALVTGGVFAFTRNPMYLGMLLVLAGWGVWLANAGGFVVLLLYLAYMNRFQIAPEEAAMTRQFGRDYEAYCQRVRRWL